MAVRTRHKLWIALGAFIAVIAAVVLLWDWNWFRPIVEARASTAIGRKVTIGHLHVSLGRVTTATAEDVTIANPDNFPQTDPFAVVAALKVEFDVMAFLHDRSIVIPLIELHHPVIAATQEKNGEANWNFSFPTATTKPGDAPSTSPGPTIGDLQILDGHAHFVSPQLKADVNVAIDTKPAQSGQNTPGPTAAAQSTPAQNTPAQSSATQNTAAPNNGQDGRIEADAKGTYSNQPITARFVGGTLLSLRDNAKPYPVDLHIANGPTHVDLVGTVQDPVKFAGANLKLDFAGPDMALLYPLTGIPIPQTPPFRISGMLDIAGHTIKFQHFEGRVGSSDLDGDIDVTPGAERPLVVANLHSRQVDLADLGGFIGSTPGRASTPGETPAQRQQTARAEASPKLIPNTPINLPKLRAADVHLKYRGARIEGRSMPFDNIVVDMTIEDGNITLKPLSFGVGSGQISSDIALSPRSGDNLHAKAEITFHRVDLSRLMAATHVFHGGGVIGGSANITTTGDSLSSLLGNGDGGVRLFMTGGDLSALLVDISGLEFGNAILSALGIPNTATVRCFIGDLGLTHGVLETKVLALDTSESNIHGTGTIDLGREVLNYQLKTQANHFTIGTFPTPIDLTGTFKHPSVRPEALPLAARAGAAIGLGIVFPPLALLPTIQLGLGEDNDCARSVKAQR